MKKYKSGRGSGAGWAGGSIAPPNIEVGGLGVLDLRVLAEGIVYVDYR